MSNPPNIADEQNRQLNFLLNHIAKAIRQDCITGWESNINVQPMEMTVEEITIKINRSMLDKDVQTGTLPDRTDTSSNGTPPRWQNTSPVETDQIADGAVTVAEIRQRQIEQGYDVDPPAYDDTSITIPEGDLPTNIQPTYPIPRQGLEDPIILRGRTWSVGDYVTDQRLVAWGPVPQYAIMGEDFGGNHFIRELEGSPYEVVQHVAVDHSFTEDWLRDGHILPNNLILRHQIEEQTWYVTNTNGPWPARDLPNYYYNASYVNREFNPNYNDQNNQSVRRTGNGQVNDGSRPVRTDEVARNRVRASDRVRQRSNMGVYSEAQIRSADIHGTEVTRRSANR